MLTSVLDEKDLNLDRANSIKKQLYSNLLSNIVDKLQLMGETGWYAGIYVGSAAEKLWNFENSNNFQDVFDSVVPPLKDLIKEENRKEKSSEDYDKLVYKIVMDFNLIVDKNPQKLLHASVAPEMNDSEQINSGPDLTKESRTKKNPAKIRAAVSVEEAKNQYELETKEIETKQNNLLKILADCKNSARLSKAFKPTEKGLINKKNDYVNTNIESTPTDFIASFTQIMTEAITKENLHRITDIRSSAFEYFINAVMLVLDEFFSFKNDQPETPYRTQFWASSSEKTITKTTIAALDEFTKLANELKNNSTQQNEDDSSKEMPIEKHSSKNRKF